MVRDEGLKQGVTVVVPTLQRGDFLADCLRDLGAQSHRPLEILVVDQSDSVPEPVAQVLRELGDLVSHYRVTFRGLPNARNFGWQKARYEAVVYVDDDVRVPPDFVARHLDALCQPGVGIVAGGIDEKSRAHDPGPPTGAFDRLRCEPVRGFAARGRFDVTHAPGGNFSGWRHVFESCGGFDEALSYGAALYEELDLCLRARAAGHRVVFDGEARLLHLAAPAGGCRVDEVGRYNRGLGHNRGIIIARHLRRHERPTAWAFLVRLFAAYARQYREPRAITEGIAGARLGYRRGMQPPTCTLYGPEHLRPEA
jgi:GT2 family glycosyltransferase